MADPQIIPITPVETWVKVATAVQSGVVHSMKGPAKYIHTYRKTGEVAPGAPEIVSEGVRFNGVTEPIEAPAPIDVYIACLDAAGGVRVDI